MKILYVTTIGLTMCFFPEHIKMLLAEGHSVELACNDMQTPVPEVYQDMGLKVHTIPFSRSPLSADNLKAYRQFQRLMETGHYDLVHTHTPNASVIVRLACRKLRKKGLKVFYTSHGFHFYKGAPLANWLICYPVEKLCSLWTDTLITINQEDYQCAKTKMHAKQTAIMPGVGVDLTRFTEAQVDREAVRRDLGIAQDAKVLIYIAELNRNKNQTSLLDMMAVLNQTHPEAVLLLVGPGQMRQTLEDKAKALGIGDKVIFTGFRSDIPQLLKASDICVPSSIREGFGLNLIEAMASGIPVVAYDNRGHRTVVEDGISGELVPNFNAKEMAGRIQQLLENPERMERYRKMGHIVAQRHDTEHAVKAVRTIYAAIQEVEEIP